MFGNSLIRKIRLILKFMTSHTGKQRDAIHILPNISRSKGNQTMKFGQLIEYSTRNNFEKSYTKYPGLNIPRPLQKKIKIEDISGSIHVNSVML